MIHEIIIVGASFFHPHTSLDSLGVETINGKIFVIHKVDEKETLYAIARRYNASIESIMQSNPGMTNTLEIGQIVKVPYTKKGNASVAVTTSPQGGQVHKVGPKETMYSISRMYGVTVDEIRQWNNLPDNAISIGQELVVKKPRTVTVAVAEPKTTSAQPKGSQIHVVAAQETLYSIARKYNLSVQQLKSWNNLPSDELKLGQELNISSPTATQTSSPVTTTTTPKTTTPAETKQTSPTVEPVKSEPVVTASQTKTPNNPQTIRISESVKSADEVMETGVAELIEGTEGNRKYLALHRTAAVGTILKVKNEMNNREVFVRVMGKLPDTAVNDKLIIKLSRSAYDRLGAIDPKFRVEVTYYK
jgi:LysM repeat protein